MDRIEVGAAVAGTAAVLALDGSADLPSLQDGSAACGCDGWTAAGPMRPRGASTPPASAWCWTCRSRTAGWSRTRRRCRRSGRSRSRPGWTGRARAPPPTLALQAGPLRAEAHGTLDLDGRAADLDVTGSAPAMQPRADVSWQGITLDAHVRGPFTKPDAKGQLRMDGLEAAGAAVRRLVADIEGNAGRVGLHARAEGVRLPGAAPDLLAAAPVLLDADARLDDPARPVTFALSHPLLTAKGSAQTGGDLRVVADLAAPDLQPLGGAGRRGPARAHRGARHGRGIWRGHGRRAGRDLVRHRRPCPGAGAGWAGRDAGRVGPHRRDPIWR